uniref:Uncharacterized protein n=1 Tax=Schistosoma haematobium TaxID=6185 RepID=A0A095A3R7_SCHHA
MLNDLMTPYPLESKRVSRITLAYFEDINLDLQHLQSSRPLTSQPVLKNKRKSTLPDNLACICLSCESTSISISFLNDNCSEQRNSLEESYLLDINSESLAKISLHYLST